MNGEESHVWTYDASQVLTEYEDKESGREHTYGYDITGRLSDVRVRDADSGDVLLQAEYSYNNVDEPEKEQLTAGGRTLTTSYTYNKNGQLASMIHGDITKTYTYDILGRMYKKNIPTTTPIQYNYVYYMSNQASEDGVAFRTTRLDRELLGNQVYSYTYDSMGNITAIYSGNRVSGTDIDVENSSLLVSYQYDSLGQLIRENSVLLGKTIVYTYDAGGNLTSKKIYSYTTSADVSSLTPADTITYTYDTDWTDKLVSYDGQSITYDAIGNPLSYRGKTMDWEGRQLVSLTGTNLNVSYTYDADGIRTKKTVNGTVIQYFYSGGQLVYEERGNEKLHYLYDTYGNLTAIYYYDADGNEEVYHVVVNSRGDVEALYDSAGTLKVRYQYDSWGKMVSVQDGAGNEITDAGNIGLVNPIRYRGYYYDAEMEWYYLGSRYYDPEVGRFISADGKISSVGGDVNGYNLYVYCCNNPVNMTDPDGNWPQFIKNAAKWVTQNVIKPTAKWVAKNVVKPVTNAVKKALSKVNKTYSTGVNISGTPSVFCFNAQGGISVDTKGNVAVQGSFSGGVTGGTPSASITVYQSKSNAPNINKLEGVGYQLGGSIGIPIGGVPIAGGADFNIIPDADLGKYYYGSTTSLGVGVPGAELHVEWGNTVT